MRWRCGVLAPLSRTNNLDREGLRRGPCPEGDGPGPRPLRDYGDTQMLIPARPGSSWVPGSSAVRTACVPVILCDSICKGFGQVETS